MKNLLKISFVTAAILIIISIGLYKFATDGRHGYWSKDFETGLTNALSVENYAIEKITNIAVEEVPTTRIHSVRLFLLRSFASVGLINYPQENAKQYSLKSSTNPDEIVCRTLFSGDHVMAISVELSNNPKADNIKTVLNEKFDSYEIVWE